MAQHQVMEHRFACNEEDCDYSFVSRYGPLDKKALNHIDWFWSGTSWRSMQVSTTRSTWRQTGTMFVKSVLRVSQDLRTWRSTKSDLTLSIASSVSKASLQLIGLRGIVSMNTGNVIYVYSTYQMWLIVMFWRSDGNRPGEKVLCEMCGKNFRQLHILRKHREIAHKYPCDLCDKRWVGWGGGLILTFCLGSQWDTG